jgi:hypothetical protein
MKAKKNLWFSIKIFHKSIKTYDKYTGVYIEVKFLSLFEIIIGFTMMKKFLHLNLFAQGQHKPDFQFYNCNAECSEIVNPVAIWPF